LLYTKLSSESLSPRIPAVSQHESLGVDCSIIGNVVFTVAAEIHGLLACNGGLNIMVFLGTHCDFSWCWLGGGVRDFAKSSKEAPNGSSTQGFKASLSEELFGDLSLNV
jgi:hypothetical protein